MEKILFLWDVKSRGSPATSFYRALLGYDYKTKGGKCHSRGVLDELPDDGWDFVSRSAILVRKKHVSKVEEVFQEFDSHVDWKKYMVIKERR